MGRELKSSVTESNGKTVCRLGLFRPQASLASTWRQQIITTGNITRAFAPPLHLH